MLDEVRSKVIGNEESESSINFSKNVHDPEEHWSNFLKKQYLGQKVRFQRENEVHISEHLIPDVDSSPSETFDQTLSKINISAPRSSITEKMDCIVSINWDLIRIPRPRKPLIEPCWKWMTCPPVVLLGKSIALWREAGMKYELLDCGEDSWNFLESRCFVKHRMIGW